MTTGRTDPARTTQQSTTPGQPGNAQQAGSECRTDPIRQRRGRCAAAFYPRTLRYKTAARKQGRPCSRFIQSHSFADTNAQAHRMRALRQFDRYRIIKEREDAVCSNFRPNLAGPHCAGTDRLCRRLRLRLLLLCAMRRRGSKSLVLTCHLTVRRHR